MARAVVWAAEVRRARAAGKLVVPSDALITPLAHETARDLGVTLIQGDSEEPRARGDGARADLGDLAAQVSTIVASVLASGDGAAAPLADQSRHPVTLADARAARFERFPYPGPPPGMDVRTAEVVTTSDGSPVAVGYMTMTKGSFPWTLTYDEVQVVLEGELHLGGDAGDKVGRPGDILFVPNGSSITFGTPEWVKFVYVTFPANWEEQIP